MQGGKNQTQTTVEDFHNAHASPGLLGHAVLVVILNIYIRVYVCMCV